MVKYRADAHAAPDSSENPRGHARFSPKSNFALAVAILQARTALKAFAAEVGASRSRPEIATGKAGELLGGVGISGDPADSAAATAVAGIAAAGLKANPGA